MVRHPIKRFLPLSLLGRSLLIIIVPLVLLQVVSAIIFFERHWTNVTRRAADSLTGEIATVIRMLNRAGDDATEARWALHLARQNMDLRITLEPGTELPRPLRGPRSTLERLLEQSLDNGLAYPLVVDSRAGERDLAVDVELPRGVLHVLAQRERLVTSTTYIFIMWMVGASLVLATIAIMFMRNQVRPIKRLARAADAFGKGRDVVTFRPSGATEVRQASAAFIAMRDRIRRQLQQRTDMLSGVSHDLRTPLTRMKLQLAMLGDGPEIDELKSDVTEMERMIEGYLTFARGEGTEAPVATEIGALLTEVARGARRNGAVVDLHVEQPVTLPLRREAFKRSISNILINAARYAHHVAVRAGEHRGAVEITIDDDGPGVPPEKREEVFRPFYRIDGSRNPDTGGTGLGLTIARDIVRGHGGDLTLEDAPTGGLRARIRVPL